VLKGEFMAVIVGHNYLVHMLTLFYTTLHHFIKIFTISGPHNGELHRSKYPLTKSPTPLSQKNSHLTFVVRKKRTAGNKSKMYTAYIQLFFFHSMELGSQKLTGEKLKSVGEGYHELPSNLWVFEYRGMPWRIKP
jgi:hypothetical protein